MIRLPTALCLVLALAAAGCSDPDPAGPVEIRVLNASTVVLQDVVIGFPEDLGGGGGPVEPGDAESGDVAYGTIEPEAATPYRTIVRAYSYAAVTAVVDGQPIEFVPDDYVGEDFLEPGRYTYALSYDGSSLGIGVVRD